MKKEDAGTVLEAAAKRVNDAARDIRDMASDVVGGSDENEGGRARATADALGVVSNSLEKVADGARASGLAVRDRGRDAARALSRGERVLRDGGYPGAAVGLALLARRNAGRIAAVGAGVGAFIALRSLLSRRGGEE